MRAQIVERVAAAVDPAAAMNEEARHRGSTRLARQEALDRNCATAARHRRVLDAGFGHRQQHPRSRNGSGATCQRHVHRLRRRAADAEAREQSGEPHHRPQLAALQLCNRSEEHTSELQSLMRISYAVFCLNKKKKSTQPPTQAHNKYKSYKT